MLRQSLRSLGGDTEALMAAAEITPTARAEELTVAQFAALARALEKMRRIARPNSVIPDLALGSTSLLRRQLAAKLVGWQGQALP